MGLNKTQRRQDLLSPSHLIDISPEKGACPKCLHMPHTPFFLRLNASIPTFTRTTVRYPWKDVAPPIYYLWSTHKGPQHSIISVLETDLRARF